MNMAGIDILCRLYRSPEACPNDGSYSGDAVGCIFVGLNALQNGDKKEAPPMRTKLLLTGIAALFLATGTAHAATECLSVPCPPGQNKVKVIPRFRCEIEGYPGGCRCDVDPAGCVMLPYDPRSGPRPKLRPVQRDKYKEVRT